MVGGTPVVGTRTSGDHQRWSPVRITELPRTSSLVSDAPDSARRSSIGFIALVAGGAAIACAPIFVRLADVSPSASAFWRVFMAAVPLWLWVLLERRMSTGSTEPHPPLMKMGAAGLFFAGNLVFWHLAIMNTAIADATLEANLAPIFVTLGAWLFLGQRVTRGFVAALGITLAGAFLLVAPRLSIDGASRGLIGDVYGLVTALFYAGYLLTLNTIGTRVSAARVAAIASTVGAIVLLPYALAVADRFWPATPAGWWPLVGLALIAHTFGQTLIAFGLARVKAGFGAVTLLVQAILAAVYAWVLLGEAMGPLQMIGAAVVLTGIALARRSA